MKSQLYSPEAAIREQLLAKGAVADAMRMVAEMSTEERSVAFESHLIMDIDNTGPRIQLDRALWNLGLLELGIQFGVAEPEVDRVRSLFATPEVRRYAFRYYPQLLPLLFAERLEGRKSVAASPRPLQREFMDVLSLDKRLEGHRIRRFLDVVDDYRYPGLPSIDEVIRRLRKPDSVRALLEDPRRDNFGDEAALGLLEFVDWSLALKRLIDRLPPMLGSTTWHQFGYWMGLVGGTLYGVLATSIESVRDAIAAENPDDDVAQKAARNMDAQLDALRWLTSSLYAAPLETWRYNTRSSEVDTQFEGVRAGVVPDQDSLRSM